MVSRFVRFFLVFFVFGLSIGIIFAQTATETSNPVESAATQKNESTDKSVVPQKTDTEKTTTGQPVQNETTPLQKEEPAKIPSTPVTAPAPASAPLPNPAPAAPVQKEEITGKTKVAVMDFESMGRDVKENSLGLSVSDTLRTILFNTKKFDVVERNFLVKLLEEQKLQLSGIVDSETAVQIGKLSGAGKLIVGSVSRIGSKYTINTRLIDIKTGSVEKAESLTGKSEDDIPPMIEDIAKLLMGETVNRDKYQTQVPDKKPEPVVEPVKQIEPSKPMETTKKAEESKKEEPKVSKRKSTNINIGIKGGIFYLLDSKLSEDFGLGFIYGGAATLWISRLGIQFDYEKYNNTGEKTDRVYSGTTITTTKTDTEIDMTPNWFSLIIRGKSDNASLSYGYLGFGIGNIKTEKTVTINKNVHPTISETFNGQQFFIGFNGQHAGLCMKYSKIPTNTLWRDIDLGGLTATLGIYF
ncbi:MAG: hypothetical protein A2551_06230 [Elusimicrobia bacterium RIFOXYD2_FULL_34_30]|nr:MAG: hypothetical protein A2551_06230 [Elusimicrobia bacterium RIFOXYD2_FULL_34_30]